MVLSWVSAKCFFLSFLFFCKDALNHQNLRMASLFIARPPTASFTDALVAKTATKLWVQQCILSTRWHLDQVSNMPWKDYSKSYVFISFFVHTLLTPLTPYAFTLTARVCSVISCCGWEGQGDRKGVEGVGGGEESLFGFKQREREREKRREVGQQENIYVIRYKNLADSKRTFELWCYTLDASFQCA